MNYTKLEAVNPVSRALSHCPFFAERKEKSATFVFGFIQDLKKVVPFQDPFYQFCFHQFDFVCSIDPNTNMAEPTSLSSLSKEI